MHGRNGCTWTTVHANVVLPVTGMPLSIAVDDFRNACSTTTFRPNHSRGSPAVQTDDPRGESQKVSAIFNMKKGYVFTFLLECRNRNETHKSKETKFLYQSYQFISLSSPLVFAIGSPPQAEKCSIFSCNLSSPLAFALFETRWNSTKWVDIQKKSTPIFWCFEKKSHTF